MNLRWKIYFLFLYFSEYFYCNRDLKSEQITSHKKVSLHSSVHKDERIHTSRNSTHIQAVHVYVCYVPTK